MASKKYHQRLKRDIVKGSSPQLEALVYFVGVAEPVMTIPQAYLIWKNRDATGISITTWSFYVFAILVWLYYGIRTKSRPLIVSSLLWLIAEGAVLSGALIYGNPS